MTNRAATILAAVKNAIRHPYAWPGGYPLAILMSDCETIDCQSARENWKSIVHATLQGYHDDWNASAVFINWEDEDLVCAHSGRPIECAYPSD